MSWATRRADAHGHRLVQDQWPHLKVWVAIVPLKRKPVWQRMPGRVYKAIRAHVEPQQSIKISDIYADHSQGCHAGFAAYRQAGMIPHTSRGVMTHSNKYLSCGSESGAQLHRRKLQLQLGHIPSFGSLVCGNNESIQGPNSCGKSVRQANRETAQRQRKTL